MIGKALRPVSPGEKVEVSRFDNGLEFARKAATCPKDERSTARQAGRAYWAGTNSFEEALDLAANGWPEGRARVEALVGNLTAELSGRIHREEWSPTVEGPVIDVAQFIEGEPECCRVLTLEEAPIGSAVRHARILYNASVSGGIGAEQIEARGAAAAALVDLLELAGFAVSLDFVDGTRSGDSCSFSYVTVKPENARVDLNDLMFWLAHPAALRRLSFGEWESRGDAWRSRFRAYVGGGYGTPADPVLTEGDRQPDVYFPAAHYSDGWSDPTFTRDWLTKTLAELGVSLTAV